MSFGSFDAYTLKARVYAALLAIAPLIAAGAAIVPWDRLSWIHGLATAAVPLLLWAAADIARQLGRRLEGKLYIRWGGKPTTVALRHSSNMLIDAGSKAHCVAFVGDKIGAAPPSALQEMADLSAADAFYERCGNWLRENTRDTKKFALLFTENVTYGYRRNLLALKPIALAVDTILIVVASIAYLIYQPEFGSEHATRLFIISGAAIIHALLLVAAVTVASVQDASHAYARQLLLSCETLRTSTQKRQPLNAG